MPGAFQSSSQAANLPRNSASSSGVNLGASASPSGKNVTITLDSASRGGASSNSILPLRYMPFTLVSIMYPSNGSASVSGCIRHNPQLHHAPFLFFFQILAALLDVHMIPRQQLGHRPRALRVRRGVDTEIREGLPPKGRFETLFPAVQPAAAPPGFF